MIRSGTRFSLASWRRAFALATEGAWTSTAALALAPLSALAVAWAASRMPAEALPRDLALRQLQVFSAFAHLVAFTVAPALAASSISSEQIESPVELFTLAGVSPLARARTHVLSAALVTSMLVCLLGPVSSLPYAFGGVRGVTFALVLASAIGWTVPSAALGALVGGTARSPGLARVVAASVGALTAVALWWVIGLGLGARVCAHLHIGHHGSAWWAELATDPRAPFRVRALLLAALAVAPWLVASLLTASTAGALAEPYDDAVTPLRARWLALSLAALALGAAAPGCAPGPSSRAWTAAAVIASWAVLQGAGVFLLLGGAGVVSRRTRARWETSKFFAIRRAFGPGLARGARLHALVCVAGFVTLASTGARVIGGHGASARTPLMVAAVGGSATMGLMGVGLLLRAHLGATRARLALAAIVSAWILVPPGLCNILGGRDGPVALARSIEAASPWRIASLLEHSLRALRPSMTAREMLSLPDARLVACFTAGCAVAGVVCGAAALFRRRSDPDGAAES